MPRTFARIARRAPATLLIATAALLWPLDASAAEEPARMTGREIADRVLERLRADPAVDAEQIGVVVVDGEVTVSGGVPSLEVKQRAERIAEHVAGVKSVRNRLRVRVSTPHTDRQLTHYVERALASDPATSDLGIEASTTNGVVTLRGSVPSLAEKQLAEAIASDLFAVRSVRNRIAVNAPGAPRAPAEIAADVRSALDWDARLDGGRIAVRVDDGIVHLEGRVASVAARRHAIEDAWVRGVTEVKADALVVEAESSLAAAEPNAAKRTAQHGEELRRAVLRGLQNHPRLAGVDVDVSVDAAGRVTLRGVVESVKAKRTASELVRGRLGVRDVRNRLYVDPTFTPAHNPVATLVGAATSDDEGTRAMLVEAAALDEGEGTKVAASVEPSREGREGIDESLSESLAEVETSFDDDALAKELREALRRDAYLSERSIDVDVIRGHAYLAGDVPSAFERARAEDVVARLRGVTAIHNEIVVERPPPEGEAGGALGAREAPIYEWSDS